MELVFLILAILISIESLKLPLGSLRDPGPGFFPLTSGIIMGLLSISIFIKSRISRQSKASSEPWYGKDRWKKLVLVLAILSGYALILESVGYLIGTFLLMFFLFKIGRKKRLITTIGASLFISMASYLIISIWLKNPLPKGVLGF